jgi:N-methylhydantoinase A
VEDGRPFQVAEYEVVAGISVGSRMFKGGGHTLRVPALDIAEVGAGGGSLVRVDTGGGLRVGPESAGAVPGPVCYGLGNEQPTLTDANLVLGYLNQTHLLGGALPIDGAAARRALQERVAGPLGLDPLSAAYGAHQIAVSNMVRVARAVSTERGRDPRRCVLVAFGGNGPVHAAEVARQLGIGEVIVPPWPGLFSAFGLLAAETRHEISQARRMRLAGLAPSDLAGGFRDLERSALATLREEGHAEARITIDRFLDLRYRGQSSELRVPVPDLDALHEVSVIAAAFEDEHERTYGYRDGPERVEIVSFRVVARVAEDLPPPLVEPRRASAPSSRPAYFGAEHGTLETPVLDRGDLDLTPRPGPLIVEEYDATTIVPPGWSASLDAYANIRLASET